MSAADMTGREETAGRGARGNSHKPARPPVKHWRGQPTNTQDQRQGHRPSLTTAVVAAHPDRKAGHNDMIQKTKLMTCDYYLSPQRLPLQQQHTLLKTARARQPQVMKQHNKLRN